MGSHPRRHRSRASRSDRTERTWTLCSGFYVQGHECHLFLNDSTHEDGAGEWGVILGGIEAEHHVPIGPSEPGRCVPGSTFKGMSAICSSTTAPTRTGLENGESSSAASKPSITFRSDRANLDVVFRVLRSRA